jgi:CRISPR-associated protein Cas6
MISSVNFAASPDAIACMEPFVELKFPVRGKYLPADHNYGLYAALVHLIPELRQENTVSILTIPGFGDQDGKIILTEKSCIRIRLPISKIPLIYRLAGKRVSIGIHEIQIGIPEVLLMRPAARLKSRIVTIKGYTEPEPFLSVAQRHLNELGISGEVTIPIDRNGKPSRKTIKIKRYTIVGFTTEVSNLTDEDSLKLQQWGLGGKRHMGCGFFIPFKGGRDV